MAKIAVVGCGAMGSVYAALMVDAGHEVHAVTLWPDHAEAMASQGLRCEGASGDRTVPIRASAAKRGCDDRSGNGMRPPRDVILFHGPVPSASTRPRKRRDLRGRHLSTGAKLRKSR